MKRFWNPIPFCLSALSRVYDDLYNMGLVIGQTIPGLISTKSRYLRLWSSTGSIIVLKCWLLMIYKSYVAHSILVPRSVGHITERFLMFLLVFGTDGNKLTIGLQLIRVNLTTNTPPPRLYYKSIISAGCESHTVSAVECIKYHHVIIIVYEANEELTTCYPTYCTELAKKICLKLPFKIERNV